MRRILIGAAAVVLGFGMSANSADIIWAHQSRGGGGALTWEDDQWRQLIEGQGHTIVSHDRYDDLEGLSDDDFQATIDAFEAADLVIMSRDSASGDYNDAFTEHPFWTSDFSTPLMIMTPYLLRSNRWDMVASTTIQDALSPMVPIVADHPLFEGVEVDGNGEFDFWSPLGDEDHIDLVGTTDFGYAEVLAVEADSDIPWIAYWEGTENNGDFYDGSTTFSAGPRLFLSAGSDDDPNTWGEKNITPAGDQIFLNAIEFLTGDPGNPVDTCVPGPGDFDGNGKVEFADFLVLSANFGQDGGAADGDADCNGKVEFADFLTLSANFGQDVGGAQAVPEPDAGALFAAMTLGLMLIRGRRVS